LGSVSRLSYSLGVSTQRRTADARGDSSAGHFGDATAQEALLRLGGRERERALVGAAGLVAPAQPPEEVGARGVEVLVAVEVEDVDEREARGRPFCFGDRDRAL